jgi:DNA-binding transcriptional MerR regulator
MKGGTMHVCGRGHELRGPQDRLSNGVGCRHCHRENQRAYSLRQRHGLAILATAEQHRLSAREVIEFLATAPPELIRHWQAMDPEAAKQLREKIGELLEDVA